MNDEHGPVLMDYGTKETRPRRKFIIIRLSLLFLVLVIVGVVFLGTFATRRSCSSSHLACAANLREIGMALYIYHNNYADTDLAAVPWICENQITFDRLIELKLIGDNLLYCPHSSGKSVSYRRVLSSPQPMEGMTPIYIEIPGNHVGGGGNVLFDIGHVEWLKPDELAALIQSATFEDERKVAGEMSDE